VMYFLARGGVPFLKEVVLSRGVILILCLV